MIILLAESKTMASQQDEISEQEYLIHRPLLEDMADKTMAFIATLNCSQISEMLGVSSQLSRKIINLAYEFPAKTKGNNALHSFTGDAYRALDASSLNRETIIRANKHLRIISSLYGILKPDDIIKPYRLDFNKDCGPDHVNMTKYLKSKVTISLVNFIKQTEQQEIIDLLPADASKCLDWKIIRAFSKVNKICFQTLTPAGKLRTPQAARLKELRGKMTRFILQEDIKTFSDLINYRNDDFVYSPDDSKLGLPVFITSE